MEEKKKRSKESKKSRKRDKEKTSTTPETNGKGGREGNDESGYVGDAAERFENAINENAEVFEQMKISGNKLAEKYYNIIEEATGPNGKVLEIMNFAGLNLKVYPPEIEKLTFGNMKVLDFSQNALTRLPAKLGTYMPNLTALDLNNNNIQEASHCKSILGLQNLKSLHLSDNGLHKVPIGIGKLSLEDLSLANNDIVKLPKHFGDGLKNLHTCNLTGNGELCEAPFLSNCTLLTTLSMRSCSFVAMPDMSKLTKLVAFDGALNKMDDFPTFAPYGSLTTIHVEGNRLKTIPDSIGSLENLEVLNASRNQIKTISRSIGKCKNLRILRVQRNQIEALYHEVMNCTSLKELDVSNNNIVHIHSSIDKLKDLKFLNFANNKVQHLPLSIITLSLADVKLNGNDYDRKSADTIQVLKFFATHLHTTVPEFANINESQEVDIGRHGHVNITTLCKGKLFRVVETGEMLHPLSVRANKAELALRKMRAVQDDKDLAAEVLAMERKKLSSKQIVRHATATDINNPIYQRSVNAKGLSKGKTLARKPVNYGHINRSDRVDM